MIFFQPTAVPSVNLLPDGIVELDGENNLFNEVIIISVSWILANVIIYNSIQAALTCCLSKGQLTQSAELSIVIVLYFINGSKFVSKKVLKISIIIQDSNTTRAKRSRKRKTKTESHQVHGLAAVEGV